MQLFCSLPCEPLVFFPLPFQINEEEKPAALQNDDGFVEF